MSQPSPQPRVLVVEHQRNAGAGVVGERLHAAGLDVHLVGPQVGTPPATQSGQPGQQGQQGQQGQPGQPGVAVPTTPHGYDGVVVLGGASGPTEDDVAPWLPDVRALMAACLADDVPLLGICLGAQMLAVVAGGQVCPAGERAEVGLCEVQPTPAAHEDPLMAGLPQTAPAVQWHYLEVDRLPDGAQVLASSDRCPHQAFRVGAAAWGVQFHPEALGETVRGWASNDGADLARLGLDGPSVVAQVEAAEDELRRTWEPLADRWADVVRARWAGAPA